jgi:hypothetical protein
MCQRVRAGWLLTLVFTVYLCLDFSSPFVPGAFVFDADQSVDGVVMHGLGVGLDGPPVVTPFTGAIRVVEVSSDRPTQPRIVVPTEWVVVLREAQSRSSDRSSLLEVH